MSDSKIFMLPDQNCSNPLATAAMMNGEMNGMWSIPLTF